MRKEMENLIMISNKESKAFYQKNNQRNNQKPNNTINFNQSKVKKNLTLIPKTVNQESYILALQNANTDIVVVTGPAGTGKTYLAMLAAIQAYRDKTIDRIVLTRPAVGVDDEKHGFLPGDLNAKMEPWTKPLIDVLREYYSVADVEYMIKEQIVEIAPLAFMRGRTFKNSFIILDEAQNATPIQIKMLLTRIGENSKIVITGDIEQTDRKKADNGLMDLQARLGTMDVPGLELCKFTQQDVQRHKIIEHIINLYNQ